MREETLGIFINVFLWFLPSVAIIVGLTRWFGEDIEKRNWRKNIIGFGFGIAAISNVNIISLAAYMFFSTLGYQEELAIAFKWGLFMWPISLFAIVIARIGRGSGRINLGAAGCGLLFLWTMSFIH